MRSARVTPNTVATPSDYNALVNDSSGAAVLLAHQMYGTIALPTNPGNTQTLTLDINGTNVVITFVSSIGSTAGNVLIGATAAATAANLLQLLLNPTITNTTQVAIGLNTSVNVTLVNYINWSLSGTNIVTSSYNSLLYAPATSFSASTTATGGSYTANTLKLYVEPGVVYVNGTEIYFAGASTSAVTAPVSHPRIDLLSLDNTGTLNWTTGTENVSPSAPAYPANQLPICEIMNVVGETALYDNANQTSGQGYILNDVRPFLMYPINLAAVPDSIIPSADGTYNLGSASFEWNNGYFKTGVFVAGIGVAIGKFGGTGTSGSIAITTGTTTVSAGNASYLEENYSSVSITGTAKLAFSTPHANGTFIVIKSQAAVTLTSSTAPNIDVSSMGAAGGIGFTSTGTAGSGTIGNAGNPFYLLASNPGLGGGTPQGFGGAVVTAVTPAAMAITTILKYGGQFWVGAGGGGGGNSNSSGTGGTGGIAGGGLLIECGGALNFTGTIWSKGAVGGSNTTHGGAGGGGAGGLVKLIYNILTANTGTITVTGGSGTTGDASEGGGGGATPYTAGGSFSGTTSGAGANGYSSIEANTNFS